MAKDSVSVLDLGTAVRNGEMVRVYQRIGPIMDYGYKFMERIVYVKTVLEIDYRRPA